jgi:hypothetical protein
MEEAAVYCMSIHVAGGEEVQAMVEQAVEAGIGDAAERVEHFMVIADQNNTLWEVRITFKDGASLLRVWVKDHQQNAADIERLVAEAMAA